MTEHTFLTSSAEHNNKISQAEFYTLYLQSLDDAEYRPTVNDEQHFHLAKLLIDRGYEPDLSGLNLRNLDFTRADFTALDLQHTDFRGAILNHADFRGATNVQIIMDTSTKFYGAQLTAAQLLEFQAAINQNPTPASDMDMTLNPV